LASQKFKLVSLTHVDTSTGVLVDVEAMAKAIKAHSPDTLVSVDGVCSIGAETLRMDEWKVDAVMTASQKALGTPSGLCVMVFSQLAMVLL
jgi:alanine-glyoxylate transaminase/serine-glyoxylate transaminase/serine-pyruvate transaminase